jgi:hypothetical protein
VAGHAQVLEGVAVKRNKKRRWRQRHDGVWRGRTGDSRNHGGGRDGARVSAGVRMRHGRALRRRGNGKGEREGVAAATGGDLRRQRLPATA